MAKHYVNNEEFLKALKKHRAAVNKAKRLKEKAPTIPEYIGKCIFDIATRFSTRPNFVMYPYREDMVMDGVENCITYLMNFDPKIGKNPFAYFTQIIYYAFLRRIEKEHKQSYVKHKVMEDEMLTVRLSGQSEQMFESSLPATDSEAQKTITDFVDNFESKLSEKKKKYNKKKTKG